MRLRVPQGEAISSLAQVCLAGDDHLHLQSGDGAKYTAGDYMLRIGLGSPHEYVRVRGNGTDTLPILARGEEGTMAIQHPVGAVVWCSPTKAYWDLVDALGGRDDDALGPGNAGAFSFAWENPCVHDVWAEPLIDITTGGGTSGALMDVGSAAGPTTHGNDAIRGLPIDAVVSYRGNPVKVGVGEYLTGQILEQNASGLAGKYYVRYWPV